MKVYLHTIGCRLNQSEMETLGRDLMTAGHDIVTNSAEADQIVINTCAVTREATRDTRRTTRRFRRGNSDAAITLTGCHATIAADKLRAEPDVHQVVPNKRKDQLLQIIDPSAIPLEVHDREPLLRDYLQAGLGNTRAFIKVQDGCHNKCTFCVTTVARGDSTSRHLGDVVAEIQALTAAGYQEAVLTGVHMGSYGHDFGNRAGLRDLVQAILAHTDIPRLRLSSLEPWEIAPDFFDLWQNQRLLPHLHMPLQAGCDRTLRRMARKTSKVSFRALVEAARDAIPQLNVSTDIICGFPGETAADFAESLDYVREIGFSRLHAFTYSPRPGTAAATMPGQLEKKVRKERVRQMIDLGRDLSATFRQRYHGQQTNVLWEQMVGADDKGVRWAGYTDNYIRVHGYSTQALFNTITPVRLENSSAEGMTAIIL